jgi:hypothetical protein
MKIGLGPAVGAEGKAVFENLRMRLAQVVDHPVNLITYARRQDLVRDMETKRLSFGLLSCGDYSRLSTDLRRGSRLLAALVLGGRRRYRGLLVRLRRPASRKVRGLVALSSSESEVGKLAELRRRHLRTRIARGGMAALQMVLDDKVEFAMVPDLTWTEAGRQGLEVSLLKIEKSTPHLPFEAFLVAPSVPTYLDSRIQALLLASKERSPRGVSVEWRVLQARAFRKECPR